MQIFINLRITLLRKIVREILHYGTEFVQDFNRTCTANIC